MMLALAPIPNPKFANIAHRRNAKIVIHLAGRHGIALCRMRAD